MAIRQIEKASGKPGWIVRAGTGDSQLNVHCQRLISAVPSFALDELPWPASVGESIQPLTGIPYSPVTVAALGFSREAITHPLDGFGMLVPEVESQPILGALFSSTLFSGRAPEGKALLTCFLGGRLHPERAEGSDDEIVARARPALESLLGVRSHPEFVQIHRWPRAIPQMELGYGTFLETMESVEKANPGLEIMGNFRHGISAPQCILAGLSR
jgi:oxygen-dependent protoporphyrinogen oxidase